MTVTVLCSETRYSSVMYKVKYTVYMPNTNVVNVLHKFKYCTYRTRTYASYKRSAMHKVKYKCTLLLLCNEFIENSVLKI